MATIRFKQFSQSAVLRRIGRDLLRKLIAPFRQELESRRIPLPQDAASDTQYYKGLAEVLKYPEQTPPRLREALFAIEDLASPNGQERLESGLQQAGLEFNTEWQHCPEQVGVNLWLFDPGILIREHQNLRKRSLKSYECFAPTALAPTRKPFVAPDPEAIAKLRSNLDNWFAQHQRGREKTRIEMHPVGSALGFFIRHADLLKWTHQIEGEETNSIQLRRKRTDSVIYSQEHDELRVSAKTFGERELYRREFGAALKGSPDYFTTKNRYTLEPLRWEREDALDAQGIEGISKIILKKIEIDWGKPDQEAMATAADGHFHSNSPAVCESCAIPTGGRISRASFLVQFDDSKALRMVEIVPPNTLKLERDADADPVTRWLAKAWLLLAGQTSQSSAEAI